MKYQKLTIAKNKEIQINLETKGVIRIKNDQAFKDIYAEVGPSPLAVALLAAYHVRYLRPLAITEKSLTVELWAHLYVDILVEECKKRKLLLRIEKLLQRIKRSTKVIDCGEASLDSNRWFWDLLSHLLLF